jgi:hypothetical protein
VLSNRSKDQFLLKSSLFFGFFCYLATLAFSFVLRGGRKKVCESEGLMARREKEEKKKEET